MLWGCFARNGTGALQKIDGITRKEDYLKILKQHLKTSARNLKLGRNWVFQQDKDPKYTAKAVTKWLTDNKVKVLEWPSQSPDLNPIENLGTELKWCVRVRRPSPSYINSVRRNGPKFWQSIMRSLWKATLRV